MMRGFNLIGSAILLIHSCALGPFALAQEQEKPRAGEHLAGPRPHGSFLHEGHKRGRKGGHEMRRRGPFQGGLGLHRRGGARWLRWLHSPRIQRELGLTEEQQQKLKEIGFQAAKAAIQQRADLQVERLELMRLMHAENPDRMAIEGRLEKIGQARTQLSRVGVNALLDGHDVLTAEQRSKIKTRLLQRGRRRHSAGPPSPPQ